MQAGERGAREAAFYESLRIELEGSANRCSGAGDVDGSPLPPLLLWAGSYREPIQMWLAVQGRRSGQLAAASNRLAAVGKDRSCSVRGMQPC